MSTPLGLRSRGIIASTATRPFSRKAGASQHLANRRHRSCHTVNAASDPEFGAVGKAAIGLGALANPIVLLSASVVRKTGHGLPPGPGGLYGAAEGVSYLVLVGIVGWSLYTKVATSRDLPAGPGGLLRAMQWSTALTLLISLWAQWKASLILPDFIG